MTEDTVQRPGHASEIQRVDEQPGVSDLPAAPAAHESPELIVGGSSQPRRLLLEGAERSELALLLDDAFHGGGAERPDQLILQILHAHVEPERLHVGAGETGAEAGPLEAALEVTLLGRVTEACQPDAEPPWTESIQEAPDVLRASDRCDGDALGVEIPVPALGQRFEREPIADPLNEHNRPDVERDPLRVFSWARQDLNLRPLACEASALPLSYAPGEREAYHPLVVVLRA